MGRVERGYPDFARSADYEHKRTADVPIISNGNFEYSMIISGIPLFRFII